MSRRYQLAFGLQGVVTLCALWASGCASIKLPAIDPTGKCIFLPQGNYTTLVPPSPGPCLPEPAFTEPPTPPPCPPSGPPLVAAPPGVPGPGCGIPVTPAPAGAVPGAAGRYGRLVLALPCVMAPVGSEVVLVCGYCDERNALVPRQTIEWMVAPDSVGQIMATDEQTDCLKFIRHRPTEKKSGAYAVTRTLASPRVLTRGTLPPGDDVSLQRGQSWVSVTSATEGTTHVAVLAPDADQWDQRRQTATIYWVDVQWTLPAQTIVQAGQPHTLTTTLRRSSGKPQADWIVRYEITGGATSFAPNSQTAIDITTDAEGAARVSLVPAQKSTTAQIAVKIIRPSRSDEETPPMIVGQGWTSVTWSAPDPKIRLSGPDTAGVGSTVTYRAEVSNAGDVVAHRVVASTRIPPTMTFLQSQPPAKVVGDLLTWELNDLAPHAVQPLQILCRPERNANVRFCVRVESADQFQGQRLTAEACVETRAFSSNLALKMSGPNAAQAGQPVTFEIELSNTGTEPLNNVVIRDRLSAGLEHPTERGSVIERALGQPLPPGATRKIAVELLAKQAGRLCHTVDAVAEGGHAASATACVDAVAAPTLSAAEAPTALQVLISGPDRARVGEFATCTLQITNTSQVPLTGVRIVNTYDPSFHPKDATNGFDVSALARRELVWSVERLPPGERVTREVRYECLQPSSAAGCRVSVASAEGARTTQDKRIQVLPAERVSPPDRASSPPGPEVTPEPAPEKIVGELKLQLADRKDPIALNDLTTYILVIENGRNVPDKNVKLTLIIPPGMEFVKINGPVGARGQSPDGRTIEVTPIAEMRAGEVLKPFYIDVRGVRIGKHTFQVTVDSFRSPQAVEARQDTTVNISG